MRRAQGTPMLRGIIEGSPLSRRALARAWSCSHNTPGRIVAGGRVDGEVAVRIAKILGRPLDELFVVVGSSDGQHNNSREAA